MRKLLFLSLMIALLSSCEKDDSIPVNEEDLKSSYLPLEVGNYWIYKHYVIDSLGNEIERNVTDSLIVTGDTIIGGEQYFRLEGTNNPYTNQWGTVQVVRDSSGYLVDQQGTKLFSEDNFTEVLASNLMVIDNDTMYTLTFHMETVAYPVTVPAGEFEVINYKGVVTTPFEIPGVDNPRYENNFYAKSVGKILGTYHYLTSPNTYEKRLVRYHIEGN